MRPHRDPRVRRKDTRRAVKGIRTGRRHTHLVKTTPPRPRQESR